MSSAVLQVMHERADALIRGDADAMMATYADDAVLINPQHIHVGKAAIRESLGRFMATLPHIKHESVVEQVRGDTVLVVWKGVADTMTVPLVVETLVFRDGKVVLQTFYWQGVPK